MKKLLVGCAGALILLVTGCQADIFPPETGQEEMLQLRENVKQLKTTGSIEVLLPGGSANGSMSTNQSKGRFGKKAPTPTTSVSKRVFASFEAFEATENAEAKGSFFFTVMKNGMMERQIEAKVTAAYVDPLEAKAWFLAEVVADTKPCGDAGGGHEDGCDGGHPEGTSCGDEDEGGHDEGCSHDEGGGEPGGPGNNGGPAVSGKDCRVGQILAVKVHDLGSPGTKDGISWKWFSPLSPNLPDITAPEAWPHLCKKEIVGGNLVVHVK